jgi:hypothetical protein
MCAIHAQHHLVGVPIGENVHADGDDEGDQHAAFTAHEKAKPHEQGRHARHQNSGLEQVHESLHLLP